MMDLFDFRDKVRYHKGAVDFRFFKRMAGARRDFVFGQDRIHIAPELVLKVSLTHGSAPR
jgi:hypothetical protein